MSTPPAHPELFHIIHINRLRSIINLGNLYSDAIVTRQQMLGTQIGFSRIKQRRALKNLASYPDLHVGDCVPFYFCPRSVMLYPIYKQNHPQLTYTGGQNAIIHLRLCMHCCIAWANENKLRWVFTDSNAGSRHFHDFNNLSNLQQLNWQAISARQWSHPITREEKQAEFLIENNVCFKNVLEIGVNNPITHQQVVAMLNNSNYSPIVSIKPNWYY